MNTYLPNAINEHISIFLRYFYLAANLQTKPLTSQNKLANIYYVSNSNDFLIHFQGRSIRAENEHFIRIGSSFVDGDDSFSSFEFKINSTTFIHSYLQIK